MLLLFWRQPAPATTTTVSLLAEGNGLATGGRAALSVALVSTPARGQTASARGASAAATASARARGLNDSARAALALTLLWGKPTGNAQGVTARATATIARAQV